MKVCVSLLHPYTKLFLYDNYEIQYNPEKFSFSCFLFFLCAYLCIKVEVWFFHQIIGCGIHRKQSNLA